jgi:hypothetical protein
MIPSWGSRSDAAGAATLSKESRGGMTPPLDLFFVIDLAKPLAQNCYEASLVQDTLGVGWPYVV